MGRRLRRWLGGTTSGSVVSSLALLLVYVLGAEANYRFVIPPSTNAVFWLPSGMNFALFVRARGAPRYWPGWLTALFFGELWSARRHGVPIQVALAWSLANCLVPLSAALMARRLIRGPFALRRIGDVIVLTATTAVAVLPGGLVAGAAAVVFQGAPFLPMALSWSSSDSLGILLVAPVLLTWTAATPRPGPGRAPEAILLLLTLLSTCWLVFHRTTASPLDRSLLLLAYFFVAWASIRFGPRATTVVLLILDIFMVAATALHRGPFGTSPLLPGAQLLNLQILQTSLGLLTLLLAAAIEEQRDARVLAEQAIQVRDEFLSVASHELNTPLASLQLSVQLLLAKTAPTPETTRVLGILERQLRRLTTLGGELLDTTRIREGRIELEREEVDLTALTREVVARTADLASRAGSVLRIEAEAPVIGRWDRLRLEQIVTNLVSNAIKFGRGQPIEIVVALEAHHAARLTVRDQGIGIPAERLPHLFDQYVQAVAQREYGGLGLGLYIVRSLVELHGGSVTVESEVDRGSTFTVRLPRSGA